MTASANAYEFPPYRGLTLKIIGDITGNYSNNVTYASDNENKIEDFRTMLNLGLNFKYSGKRRSLDFSGLMKRQIDNTSSSNIQNPSENIRLNYKEELTKYDSLILYEKYAHTEEPGKPTGDFNMEQCREYYKDSPKTATKIESICNDFNEEFGRFAGRFESYSNDFSFSYLRVISKASTLRTTYNHGKNWSDAVGTNDSDRNALGLIANYKHSEATNFSLSYKYQLSNFDRGDDITRQLIDVGIGQSFTKNIYLSVNVGKVNVAPGNDSTSLEATLMSAFDDKTSGSLSYSQGVEINANTDDTFENWQTTASLSRVLQEDLMSALSAFYGKADYSSASVSDTFIGASIRLTYHFWQGKRGSSMAGTLGYSYSDLASSSKGREYTRNSINTGLTVAF